MKEEIIEVITRLFVHTDRREWVELEQIFAPSVMLDYSSMSGNPAAQLTPDQITGGWKTVLPGFAHTHHQLGNFLTEVEDNSAHVFCYGTATHYLESEDGSVWTVVGTYDFDLEYLDNAWRVTAMTFHYKYQDGNTSLIQKAIEQAK